MKESEDATTRKVRRKTCATGEMEKITYPFRKNRLNGGRRATERSINVRVMERRGEEKYREGNTSILPLEDRESIIKNGATVKT